MYRTRLLIITGITSLALFLSSCGEKPDDGLGSADFEVTTDTVKSETRINFDLIRVNIPSPAVITQKISAAKNVYNKNFMLPVTKRSAYSSSYQKAIGMGAFGADIATAASHNQSQDALDYLGEMGKMAADLGISSAFDVEFSKKMLASISKPDSLQFLIDRAFDKAERNLRSNQRVSTAVLMVAGGWVEGLYTAVEVANTLPDGVTAKIMYKDISTHCHAFDYVYQLLSQYKNNADCAKLLKEMELSKATLLSYGNTGWDAAALPKLRDTVTTLRNKITA